MTPWICCQIGAREHYAIPRALHQTQHLHTLITDAWVHPRHPSPPFWSKTSKALSERYHPELSHSSVQAFTPSLLSFELRQHWLKSSGWTTILRRNRWFQEHALNTLKNLTKTLTRGDRPTLFSYSYTALDLFHYAKQQGWRTVLGQIDPGIVEEHLVTQLHQQYRSTYSSSWLPAPQRYWDNWHQECSLADHIIVNSSWSQTALRNAGIAPEKMMIAPLAYQAPTATTTFIRYYPSHFTSTRPLRVLFLGQLILRKGIAAIFEALPTLQHHPIELWFVGPTSLTIPHSLRHHPQIKWQGAVPRSHVQHYYQNADLFLFPTHSDGFGLTQLEAQAWKLPIIASSHCGAVVTHNQNGLILPTISGKAIADALITCCQNPQRLQQWTSHSSDINSYSLNQLALTLTTLGHATV